MSPKSTKQFIILPSIMAGVLAVAFGSLVCRKSMEGIPFGAIPSGSAALVYIAQDEGFFSANSIRVKVKEYPTGVGTTGALLKGAVDIAWAAEFPLVHRAFANEKISIIAALSRFSDQYLFARKDRGIRNISDLKAKKIGIPRNTIVEFYLARFLELNGISIEDVSLLNVLPPQSMDAITSGSIDGVVTWEPYSSRIKTQLAGEVTAWPVQNFQPGYGVIIARNDWISEHPERIRRFLKSMVQAEDYLIRHPEASKNMVKKRVNYDDAFMEIFWSENQFSLSLDQSLILAMEDEARWMIRNKLTNEKQVPDFLNYIYEDGLKAVKPESVNIIR
jgi:NitT/TauT family transport system substrate-binding protein